MKRTSLAGMACPVARTLDVIGEWWSLLIVRDAFLGSRRFEDYKTTGIADNILASRLKRLVDEGVLDRRLYHSHPERFEYVLSAKGRALLPVIGALATWGQQWTQGGGERGPRITHSDCGHDLSFGMQCQDCGRPVSTGEIRVERRSVPLTAVG